MKSLQSKRFGSEMLHRIFLIQATVCSRKYTRFEQPKHGRLQKWARECEAALQDNKKKFFNGETESTCRQQRLANKPSLQTMSDAFHPSRHKRRDVPIQALPFLHLCLLSVSDSGHGAGWYCNKDTYILEMRLLTVFFGFWQACFFQGQAPGYCSDHWKGVLPCFIQQGH